MWRRLSIGVSLAVIAVAAPRAWAQGTQCSEWDPPCQSDCPYPLESFCSAHYHSQCTVDNVNSVCNYPGTCVSPEVEVVCTYVQAQ